MCLPRRANESRLESGSPRTDLRRSKSSKHRTCRTTRGYQPRRRQWTTRDMRPRQAPHPSSKVRGWVFSVAPLRLASPDLSGAALYASACEPPATGIRNRSVLLPSTLLPIPRSDLVRPLATPVPGDLASPGPLLRDRGPSQLRSPVRSSNRHHRFLGRARAMRLRRDAVPPKPHRSTIPNGPRRFRPTPALQLRTPSLAHGRRLRSGTVRTRSNRS